MQTLYHITKKRNLFSILNKGILCGRKVRKTGITIRFKNNFHNSVFLTNDVERILKTQAGDKWIKRWDPIIFEIDIANLIIEPIKYISNGTYTLSDYEFTTNFIEKEKIVDIKEIKDFLIS